MTSKTAVAASAADPFEDLFRFIDKLTLLELIILTKTIELRLLIQQAAEEDVE